MRTSCIRREVCRYRVSRGFQWIKVIKNALGLRGPVQENPETAWFPCNTYVLICLLDLRYASRGVAYGLGRASLGLTAHQKKEVAHRSSHGGERSKHLQLIQPPMLVPAYEAYFSEPSCSISRMRPRPDQSHATAIGPTRRSSTTLHSPQVSPSRRLASRG